MWFKTCYQILFTWYFLTDACYLISFIWYLLPDICHLILVTWYLLHDTFYMTLFHLILVSRYLLSDKCYSILVTKSYYNILVDRIAQKPWRGHLSRSCRPFLSPLASILDFAGSAVLQVGASATGAACREQTKVDFQEPEWNQEVKNGYRNKPGSSNFEKQKLRVKPITKPVTSGKKSRGQPGTSWFSKFFVKCKI